MAAVQKPIRVLVAKVGLDGHDVGARVIARGLLDAGMEVLYTGIRRTPEQVVRTAIEEDVEVVGVSILSGAHETFLPRIRQLLNEQGGEDVLLIAGGVIPLEDIPLLERQGVARVMVAGTSIQDVVGYLETEIAKRRATGR